MDKIKWGIIGCGKIARKLANDMQFVPDGEIYACASLSIERGRAFQEDFRVTRLYHHYADLIADSEIDIIYVATPHSHHMKHTLLSLRGGKPVLCEKPLAINTHQASQMIETARTNGLFLMEAMWTRFIPVLDEVKSCIDAGDIGEIRHLRADFGFKSIFNPDSRLFDRKLGGGTLLDIGIYPLFIAQWLIGKPKQFFATASLGQTGVDSDCTIMCQYDNGATAALYTTFLADTDTSCEIWGTKGKIEILPRFHHADTIIITVDGHEEKKIHIPNQGLGYTHQIAHVHHCLRSGYQQSPMMTWADSMQLLETMDNIRKQIGVSYHEDTD
jgi:predicted dehydrogenase